LQIDGIDILQVKRLAGLQRQAGNRFLRPVGGKDKPGVRPGIGGYRSGMKKKQPQPDAGEPCGRYLSSFKDF
jgi:hypothetical protein